MVLFSNELSIKCEVTNHCHSLSTPLLGYIFSAQRNIRLGMSPYCYFQLGGIKHVSNQT